MGARRHTYTVEVRWTGNQGSGTTAYREYSRAHDIAAPGKPTIPGSSDPLFLGESDRYSPEEVFVGSLSACHMLWYLHLCADSGVVVTGYTDDPSGVLLEMPGAGGQFEEVVLRPVVQVRVDADVDLAARLHDRAHELCYLAGSVNFAVRCEPRVEIEPVET